MNLIGVEVVGEVVLGSRNQYRFKFKIPYSNKLLSAKLYKSVLKNKYNKTTTELILDINGLTTEDLPRCIICNIKNVKLSTKGKVNILNPKLSKCCDNKECSYALQARSLKVNGTHNSKLASKELRFQRAQRRNETALSNGKHSSQNSKNIESITYNGKLFHFNSRFEKVIFLSYKRILSKYYNQETKISNYIYNDENKIYIIDYKLKDEFIDHNIRGIKLPYGIELKLGNLKRCPFKKDEAKIVNQLKFYSVIDQNKTMLLVNGSKRYMLSSKVDIDNLFKGSK